MRYSFQSYNTALLFAVWHNFISIDHSGSLDISDKAGGCNSDIDHGDGAIYSYSTFVIIILVDSSRRSSSSSGQW